MILLLIIGQAATSPAPAASTTSTIIVVIVGGIATAIGGYFGYKGLKKQSESNIKITDKDSILKERGQLADEWKALREYQTLQFNASQKEIESLRGQIKVMQRAIDEREELLDSRTEEVIALRSENARLGAENTFLSRQLNKAIPPEV